MKKRCLYYKIGCFLLSAAMLLLNIPKTYTLAEKKSEVSIENLEGKLQTEDMTESEESESAESEQETKTEIWEEDDTEESGDNTKATEIIDDGAIPAIDTKESETSKEDSTLPILKQSNDTVIDLDESTGDETIQKPEDAVSQSDHSDAAASLNTNIIAGNRVYLNELSDGYGLSFDENFEKIMDKIEKDYRAFLKKPNAFRAENWQDVLAVYVMKHISDNKTIMLDKSCREELEQIFFLMNVRSDSAILRKLQKVQEENQDEESEKVTGEQGKKKESYALSVEDYIDLYEADKKQQEILRKYTSEKCRQLCAVVTAAKGFVRAEVGTDISEERVKIVAAACSLIGKVGYFWGGKSNAIGWDERWGESMTVSATGSRSSGTVRSYGLDCSGFVAWAYYNGLNGKDIGIGNHTTTQWNATQIVDAQDAEPGDLVFYRPGSAGDNNHVGLVVGINENGSLLVIHCSSSQNGVVVGEAWSSGFQYVRTSLNLD